MEMERIIYGSRLAPTLFEENVSFNDSRPYTISIKQFEHDELTIPHYAKTYEILVCTDIDGEIIIENRRFDDIAGRVFAIPPYFIHSMHILRSAGVQYVLKCSLEDIARYIDLRHFADASRADIFSLPLCLSGYPYLRIRELTERMIESDRDLFSRMGALLEIYSVLVLNSTNPVVRVNDSRTDPELKRLIDYTLEHYGDEITLDDAAALTGYSRYYFCRWFRRAAGLTYLEYLTEVRVISAARLIQSKVSVAEAALRCGYESVPHFIKQFKRHFGVTPGQYRYKLN